MRDQRSIPMAGGARSPALTLGAGPARGPFAVVYEDLSTAVLPRIGRQSPDNAGGTVTRDNLCRVLFGAEYNGIDRAIDVYISRIRQQLGDNPRNPAYAKTVRGIGYLFAGDRLPLK